jgi:hypothetical protein
MSDAAAAMAEAVDWIYDFVMRPHADLGRKGAVCPFMDLAMKNGRVSWSTVQLDSAADTDRLLSAAREGLDRIVRTLHEPEQRSSAALFLPLGAPDLVKQATESVQQALRGEALARGCMIGDFSPGNTTPGIHNPRFRPLDSPVTILGVRRMVDTDLAFLATPDMPAPDRLAGAARWYAVFGTSASEPLLARYQQIKAEAHAGA